MLFSPLFFHHDTSTDVGRWQRRLPCQTVRTSLTSMNQKPIGGGALSRTVGSWEGLVGNQVLLSCACQPSAVGGLGSFCLTWVFSEIMCVNAPAPGSPMCFKIFYIGDSVADLHQQCPSCSKIPQLVNTFFCLNVSWTLHGVWLRRWQTSGGSCEASGLRPASPGCGAGAELCPAAREPCAEPGHSALRLHPDAASPRSSPAALAAEGLQVRAGAGGFGPAAVI